MTQWYNSQIYFSLFWTKVFALLFNIYNDNRMFHFLFAFEMIEYENGIECSVAAVVHLTYIWYMSGVICSF